jgi:hypothetical protein
MARRISLVLTVCIVFGCSVLHGDAPQSTCAKAAIAPNPAATAYARRGPYCDGSVREDQSGPGTLAVIGITATPVSGDPAVKPVMISLLSPPTAAESRLELRAVGKSPRVNYRLDAGLAAQPLKIGSESAMSRLRLRADEVAWLAWRDTANGTLYVPVIAGGAKPRALQIMVRPTFPSAYLVYSIRAESPDRELQPEKTIKGNDEPGEPVSLVIEAGEPRIVVITVTAVAEYGETQTAIIRVVRPGSVAR